MTDTTAALPLQESLLPAISGAVAVPTYDRTAIRPSIVHIGVGGFHRSHLATYIDELCTGGHTEWGIVGCGLLPHDRSMAAALGPQDNLYTLISRGADRTDVQVIGSLIEYVHASPDAEAVMARIASPDTQILSLTVTEGGYPIDDVTGEYDPNSPNAGTGGTFSIIAAALERRRNDLGAPITIVSCDNITSNGHATRAATLGEAAAYGSDLIDWIAESVTFPNSMVDRITPATTDSDRAWLAETYNIADRWPVVAEPFRHWVVEDDFAGARLPLEELDVIVTDAVEPYEFMKLRLLNAGHSCLAYAAALDGIATVDAAMADPSISRFVRALLDYEAKPVLPDVAGIDVDAYIATLIDRFSNPHIRDQISRLCLDGSAKFPKFLLPTVRAQLAADGPIGLSALALASWCHYLMGRTDRGDDIALSADPQLDEAVSFARSSVDEPASFLDFSSVFGDDLPASPRFVAAFTEALTSIRSQPIGAAIAAGIAEVEARR